MMTEVAMSVLYRSNGNLSLRVPLARFSITSREPLHRLLSIWIQTIRK